MARNAINPTTGKRFSGRVRKSWGYDETSGEYYVPGSEYDPGNGDSRVRLDSTDGGNSTGDATQETDRVLFETDGVDRIIVEKGSAPPKASKRSTRGPGKPKGAITPAHVSSWVQMGMATVAMYRNSKIWLIQDAKVEIDPWAPSAAELLNKIPQEYAEKVTDLSAVTVVAMGVFNLVSVRLAAEQRERMELARANAERMQREEFQEYTTAPVQQAYTASPNGTEPSGARPVVPDESIFGTAV